ncbi:MAG TPA: VPDSG-CTERM sorting domain-containing protein [Opitutaceae bacterium]|nr:VPDSG-CTERM sorting domain-containing protein [Opitutaceae bacterium]
MRKLLLTFCFLSAVLSARAIITPVTDTANYLEFNFRFSDNFLSPGGDSGSYTPTNFQGGSFNFFFQDRLISIAPFLTGNLEQFTPAASGGTSTHFVDVGQLNFSGSYLFGGQTIQWSIESTVSTRLGNDRWQGTFVGTAQPTTVPDSGSGLALAILALGSLVIARRSVRK